MEIQPDGQILYIAEVVYDGTQTFTYSICDNGSPQSCDVATVTITVQEQTNSQDAVIVNDDYVTGMQDEEVEIALLNNDYDPDPFGAMELDSLEITNFPLNGTTVLNSNSGIVTYTPNPGFIGIDTFYYKACDVPYQSIDFPYVAPTCNEGLVTVRILSNNLSVEEENTFDFHVDLIEDILIVQTEENMKGDNLVYDLNGQLILKNELASKILFSAPAGMYFVVFNSDHGSEQVKLIKSN